MALQDIIQAIKAQADKEISALEDAAKKEKASIKTKADAEIASFESELKDQASAKKASMKKKAETMVDMERRKLLLEEKRKALDIVYENVLTEVQALPKDKLKKLEDALKAKVKGQKGETKASKEGGFVFVSTQAEEDFTFAHLIQTMLRPETELEVSTKLFV